MIFIDMRWTLIPLQKEGEYSKSTSTAQLLGKNLFFLPDINISFVHMHLDMNSFIWLNMMNKKKYIVLSYLVLAVIKWLILSLHRVSYRWNKGHLICDFMYRPVRYYLGVEVCGGQYFSAAAAQFFTVSTAAQIG